jgi:hypothetical protein
VVGGHRHATRVVDTDRVVTRSRRPGAVGRVWAAPSLPVAAAYPARPGPTRVKVRGGFRRKPPPSEDVPADLMSTWCVRANVDVRPQHLPDDISVVAVCTSVEAGGQGEIGGSRDIRLISEPRVWLPTGGVPVITDMTGAAVLLREGGGFLYVGALRANSGL